MNKSSEVANRLKDLRIKWNKTQTEMAKDCGVSPRMWIKYEQGLSFPGGEMVSLGNKWSRCELPAYWMGGFRRPSRRELKRR